MDRRIVADRGDAGRRLDIVLCRHLADMALATRTRVQDWMANGQVSVNGLIVRRSARRARPGDVVRVAIPIGAEPQPTLPEDLVLQVLYEDEYLLAVNKPPGMVAHPAYRHRTGTLINALFGRARLWPAGSRPSLVGRLDKLTSGVVLVAKMPIVHRELQAATTTVKEYLAVVYGRPAARGTLKSGLAADPGDRRRVAVVEEGGRACVTRFETVARAPAPRVGLALLRCDLLTGRKHQIRVHLSAKGWPLVGDPLYSAPRWAEVADPLLAAALQAFPRQALHSWRITFVHPATLRTMRVEAPPPADFDGLLAATRLDTAAAV